MPNDLRRITPASPSTKLGAVILQQNQYVATSIEANPDPVSQDSPPRALHAITSNITHLASVALPDELVLLIFIHLLASYRIRPFTDTVRIDNQTITTTMNLECMAPKVSWTLEPARMLHEAGLVCHQWYRCAMDTHTRISTSITSFSINLRDYQWDGKISFPHSFPMNVNRLHLTHPSNRVLQAFRHSSIRHLEIGYDMLSKLQEENGPLDPWASLALLGEAGLQVLQTLALDFSPQSHCTNDSIAKLPPLDPIRRLAVTWRQPFPLSNLDFLPTILIPNFSNLTTLELSDARGLLPYRLKKSPDVSLSVEELSDKRQQRHLLSAALHLAPQIKHLGLHNFHCNPEDPFFHRLSALESLRLSYSWQDPWGWREALVWMAELFDELPTDLRLKKFTLEDRMRNDEALEGLGSIYQDPVWLDPVAAFVFPRAGKEYGQTHCFIGLEELSLQHCRQDTIMRTVAGWELAFDSCDNGLCLIENKCRWTAHEASDVHRRRYRRRDAHWDVFVREGICSK